MASVGPLVAGAVMLLFDQQLGTGFFDPEGRRPDPLAAPVLVLRSPRGVRGAAARDGHRGRDHHGVRPQEAVRLQDGPLHGHRHGRLSFFVWAHHQFIAGIDPRMANVFTITTLLISIPIAEMMFLYIATLYGGSIRFTVPMLWALGFIFEFLIGGVTGIFLGASGADIYFHDTYFVIAHFHYTFFPIAFIGSFAGLHVLVPQDVRPDDERDARARCTSGAPSSRSTSSSCRCSSRAPPATTAASTTTATSPTSAPPPAGPAHRLATVACWSCSPSRSVFLFNFFWSVWRGAKAPEPLAANTLEWQCPSPPPHGNFPPDGLPVVYRGPYEYSVPGA
jgi:cytochrome c oxidase subunit 1